MRSIVSNWVTFLFSAGVNFVVSPIIVRTLGDVQYGAWVLLSSMVGYLGLLDLGVRSAVTRYIARFHASGDHQAASRLYASALRLFFAGGVLAITLSVGLALVIDRLFHIPPELVQTSRIVAVIAGVSVAIALVSGVFGGIIIGLERFDYYNTIEIVLGIARAVAVVAVLKTGHGLVALALVQLAATLARAIANVYYTRKLYPGLDLSPWAWDRASARLILEFGLAASLIHVTASLLLYSDSLVIGAFLPVGMITYFSIAGTLTEYARSMISGVSQTLTPRISALQAGGQKSDLSSAVMLSARISSLVVLPIVVTFILRGGSFIGLWMDQTYAQLSGQVLIVLSISLAAISGYQVVTAAMMGISRQRALVPMFLGEAACNLILSVILVRAYGVIGTAIGTAIPRTIVSTVIGPWYVKQHLGLDLRRFWTDVYVRPVAAILPFAAVTFAIEHFWPAHNLVVFFIGVLATLPLALVGPWFVCLSRDERASLSASLARFRRPQLVTDP
jgi:O-antigen/teichoic acid export membrane protein